MTATTWALIVNPHSGKNRNKKQYLKLIAELKKRAICFEFALTEYAGHLPILLNNFIAQGYRQFIISGGDGTWGETANALYQQKNIDPLSLKFAFAPSGTGNDWARTMQLPHDAKSLVNLIQKDVFLRQDLGKITCYNEQNTLKTHYFINVAGMGFDAFIAQNYMSGNKQMGALTYYYLTVKGLLKYKNTPFKIEYNCPKAGWQMVEGKMFEVAFGVCRYFGGGMKITPFANPTSGLIDLTMIKDVSTVEAFMQLPRMLTGAFVDFYKVETQVATHVKLSTPHPSYLQADGELIGLLPAQIELLPKAMNVLVGEQLAF